MNIDYYNLLGVNYNATTSDIKKAFRKMSLEYHPDRNNNNSEKKEIFQKINDAYVILSNEKERKKYDENIKISNFDNVNNNLSNLSNLNNLNNLSNLNLFNNVNRLNNVNPLNNLNNLENILKSEIFSGLFSNLNEYNNLFNQNIPIIEKTIEITLEQSYTGTCIQIIIDKWKLENNNKIFFKETLYIDLDSGIDDGEVILLKNKGNYINKDNIGDIQINIKIINHNIFSRNGLDLYFYKILKFKEAFCGFSFTLPFLNGKEYVINNKEGYIIYPGYQKIIKNLGMKRNNNIGNLFIEFKIEFPKNLTSEQIKFINKLF